MIAIKGMKMPESCKKCRLHNNKHHFCYALQVFTLGIPGDDGKMADCPLVEVEEPGWVKRLREEYEDLKVKRKKLCDYYDALCGTDSIPECLCLIDQERVMEMYMQILERRAELKGYTLEVKREGEE